MKVDAANCRMKEAEKIGAGGLTSRCVTVTVTGEGEVLRGMAGKSADEKLTTEEETILNERMQDYLNAVADHALDRKIDITNSYRKLGADNRAWYFQYKNAPAAYEQDIKIQYLVKINWKTE